MTAGIDRTPSPVRVIRGGTMIDGTGRAPVPNGVLLIEGDRITKISVDRSASIPPGAEVIDASGKYILPGLIDGHVHLHSWMVEPLLHYGITSILDLGNLEDWILAYKEGAEKGRIYGPRIFAVGPLLNGIPNQGPGSIEGSNVGLKDPEFARTQVRRLAAKGVDGIKFYWNTPMDVLRAATQEAHAHGLRVAIHISCADANELADAGS